MCAIEKESPAEFQAARMPRIFETADDLLVGNLKTLAQHLGENDRDLRVFDLMTPEKPKPDGPATGICGRGYSKIENPKSKIQNGIALPTGRVSAFCRHDLRCLLRFDTNLMAPIKNYFHRFRLLLADDNS